MLRRDSARGFALLGAAVVCLFFPFAAASNADRATQTLTLLALVLSLGAFALTWLVLRQRGWVGAAYLGLAALAGAFSVLFLQTLPAFADATEPDLSGDARSSRRRPWPRACRFRIFSAPRARTGRFRERRPSVGLATGKLLS